MGDQLRAWFDHVDVDRSGSIDAQELQRALAMGNLNFGVTDCDAMIRAFDTGNNRKLDYQEFTRLHFFLVNVQNSFASFDIDGSRSLAPDEIQRALRQAGFQLDNPAMMAMITKYDHDGSGHLTLDEYIRACLFLQTAARTFAAFDTTRSGTITLNFGQFVYASAHVA